MSLQPNHRKTLLTPHRGSGEGWEWIGDGDGLNLSSSPPGITSPNDLHLHGETLSWPNKTEYVLQSKLSLKGNLVSLQCGVGLPAPTSPCYLCLPDDARKHIDIWLHLAHYLTHHVTLTPPLTLSNGRFGVIFSIGVELLPRNTESIGNNSSRRFSHWILHVDRDTDEVEHLQSYQTLMGTLWLETQYELSFK